MAGLTQLNSLSLGSLKIRNKISDVTPLVGLAQLEVLSIDGNRLADVSALAGLTQLKRLFLSGNPALTKAQIDELQKALPKCKIISNPTK